MPNSKHLIKFIGIFVPLLFISHCKTRDKGGELKAVTGVSSVGAVGACENGWYMNKNTPDCKRTGLKHMELVDGDRLRIYFYLLDPGKLNAYLYAGSERGVTKVNIELDKDTESEGKLVSIEVNSPNYREFELGTFENVEAGYHFLELSVPEGSSGKALIDRFELDRVDYEAQITGVRIGSIPKSNNYFGRRGASVHLNYYTSHDKIEWFYSELTVPVGSDVDGTYAMANGFKDGYFGIQVNSPGNGERNRRILFSIWSAHKTDNPSDIPEKLRVKCLKKGDGVEIKDFGNEGSGGQSYKYFNWQAGVTYGFLVRGVPYEGDTIYAGYFYDPNSQNKNWQLISIWRRPTEPKYITSPNSFLENFKPYTGNLTRSAQYKNQWIKLADSPQWKEMTYATFTADATHGNKDRFDIHGEGRDDMFILRNTGFFTPTVKGKSNLMRKSGISPNIQLEQLEGYNLSKVIAEADKEGVKDSKIPEGNVSISALYDKKRMFMHPSGSEQVGSFRWEIYQVSKFSAKSDQFIVEKFDKNIGTYRIRTNIKGTPTCLHASKSIYTSNQLNVYHSHCDNSDGDEWFLENAGNNTFHIRSKATKLCVRFSGNYRTAKSKQLQIYQGKCGQESKSLLHIEKL